MGSLKALQTIFSFEILGISSTLEFSTLTEVRPSSFFAWTRNAVFFVFESIKLISVCGFITARHSPGKPAPLPKSTIFPGCKCLLKIALSTKYSIESFFEQFLDTKFLVLFHLSTKEIYCSPSSTCVGERDRLAWVANSFSFKCLLS